MIFIYGGSVTTNAEWRRKFRGLEIKQIIFKKTKIIKMKYINALKIDKQMCQVFFNLLVFAKQKISLTWPCLYWDQNGPKIWHFVRSFRKFCHFSFFETVWEQNYCDDWLFISNSMSGKILDLESVEVWRWFCVNDS